jgi:hypothetical protein
MAAAFSDYGGRFFRPVGLRTANYTLQFTKKKGLSPALSLSKKFPFRLSR